eukprot:127059-Lingulodinium_polyedra.AAC.1
MHMSADLLLQKQLESIENTLGVQDLKYVVFQLLFDESQFPVTFSRKERGINQRIFAMKGRLSWIRDTYAQDEED